ncbi:MAG: S-layer homology domain-containing protein [Ruminococcaceae bacterium]|nr:S-layer homology domain-containing protein [Oscillospiraceae bacterium]
MKKSRIFIALILMLSMTMSAYALECTVKYDSATNVIDLKGTAQAPVAVLVTPVDATLSALGQDNPPATSAQYDFMEEAAFEKQLVLDKNLPSGEYTVTVKSNEKYIKVVSSKNDKGAVTDIQGLTTDRVISIPTVIYHISKTDSDKLLADINAAADDADALYEVIANGKTGTEETPAEDRIPYTELLSLDAEQFAVYGEYACAQMVGTLAGGTYADSAVVLADLAEYEALHTAINSSNVQDAIGALEDNADALDVDVERFVTNLDEASQEKLVALMKNFEADGASFTDKLPELSALASMQAADRWKTIKTIVTETYDDVLNIDHEGLENEDKVYQQMMDYTYTVFEDIEDGFNKADAVVNKKTYTPPKKNNGGGGGGGGSSTVNFEIPPSRAEQREEPNPARPFMDVTPDHWGYAAINELAEKKVVSGYPDGDFRPDGTVTRAEFVKMLVSAFGITADAKASFADVSEADWYYTYINAAYGNGIVNGVGDSFNPNGAITREDACVIVYRLLTKHGALTDAKAQFADNSQFADYAADAISVLAGNGVVNGVGDNRFDAKASINRASCAVLILNCMNAK